MTLANLIDLEAQLSRDRDADPAALAARDRALLAGISAGAPGPRGALLARWLDALRAREPAALHPGRAVTGALATVRAALVLGGLLLGWGAATALLQFTGGHPVNVWDFLLVFVGLQLLLLRLLLVSFVVPFVDFGRAPVRARSAARSGPSTGGSWRAASRGEARVEEWRVVWHTLRARRSLYHAVEPWAPARADAELRGRLQRRRARRVLRLIVFSDIAFSWSTTLVELDAARFHAIVRALAAPWGWAVARRGPVERARRRDAVLEARGRLPPLRRRSEPRSPRSSAGGGRSSWRRSPATGCCRGRSCSLVSRLGSRASSRRSRSTTPRSRALVERLSGPDVQTRSVARRRPRARPAGGELRGAAAAADAP